MLAQSPEPAAHDKALDSNPDRIGIWKCWFLRKGENRSTRRKTSRSKDENQQQTQPTAILFTKNAATLLFLNTGDDKKNSCEIELLKENKTTKYICTTESFEVTRFRI